MAFLTAEHEDVGEHLPVPVFMQPGSIKLFHVLHTGDFESLVRMRQQFMTAHILVIVQQEERFDDTVLHRVAVRTGVSYQPYHPLTLHCLPEHRQVAVHLPADR